jgi:hypothetical protein
VSPPFSSRKIPWRDLVSEKSFGVGVCYEGKIEKMLFIRELA